MHEIEDPGSVRQTTKGPKKIFAVMVALGKDGHVVTGEVYTDEVEVPWVDADTTTSTDFYERLRDVIDNTEGEMHL